MYSPMNVSWRAVHFFANFRSQWQSTLGRHPYISTFLACRYPVQPLQDIPHHYHNHKPTPSQPSHRWLCRWICRSHQRLHCRRNRLPYRLLRTIQCKVRSSCYYKVVNFPYRDFVFNYCTKACDLWRCQIYRWCGTGTQRQSSKASMMHFLEEIELSQYAKILDDDGVDRIDTLLDYTIDMLTAIGVKRGHAIVLLKEANKRLWQWNARKSQKKAE